MKKINVYINSYLEYMNSILLTSRYNEITEPYIGYGLMTKEENEYTTRIKHFLEKYRNDDIYQYIESLVLNGFTFSRPVELMLSLGNNTDFSMQYTPSEMCIEYCGGISNIKELLRLLKEYEAKSTALSEEMRGATMTPEALESFRTRMAENMQVLTQNATAREYLEAKSAFNKIITSVNEIIGYHIRGEQAADSCSGNCSGCSGCH